MDRRRLQRGVPARSQPLISAPQSGCSRRRPYERAVVSVVGTPASAGAVASRSAVHPGDAMAPRMSQAITTNGEIVQPLIARLLMLNTTRATAPPPITVR